ncbi:hypothetical protein [Sphingomonas faeni]|uniref:hypothetical protein n=1 Tax=Sphingomonas faeni TaxID=185950 RepID=UPI0020C056F1|nr:hypothetical protein [Sphingomonas faeni]MCK8458701.1 hypothetical protein [Sphingomonas faeni]
MKTVKQKGEYDCGVACVAMLADVAYDEALKAIFPNGKRAGKTKTNALRDALVKLGRQPDTGRRKPFGSTALDDLIGDALVFVMLDDDGDEYHHWMVWDAKGRELRDPYTRTLPYRLRGYLLVG